jgi:hypothetical protein
MRYLLALTLTLCLPALALCESPTDTQAARQQAAARYMQVADLSKLLGDSVDAMSRNMPAEQREQFKSLMTQHLHVDVLKEAMLDAMVKTFTAQELDALATFYGSADGKSAMAKFGEYMGNVMPVLQAEMARAVAETRAEQQSPAKQGGT